MFTEQCLLENNRRNNIMKNGFRSDDRAIAVARNAFVSAHFEKVEII